MSFAKRVMMVVGIAGALALTAPTSWATGERTDILKSGSETFEGVAIDGDGNAVTDQAYDVYAYSSYRYGSIYRLVETPGGDVSVDAWFEIDEPDFVLHDTVVGNKVKIKQTDQLYVEALTFWSPGACVAGCTATTDDLNLEGCKGKIVLTGPNAPHPASDDNTASGGKTVLNCSQSALTVLFPDSGLRTSIQGLLGTRTDGTGLAWKGLNLIDTDL